MSAHAFTFSTDFDSNWPSEGLTLGSAYIDWWGGVNGSGVLKLTDFWQFQTGAFVINALDDRDTTGFTARFKMRIGGGSDPGAEGVSFNFANDLPDSYAFDEEGAGSGLSICFDTYDDFNGGGEGPAIDVKKGGQTIASIKEKLGLYKTGDFVDVGVEVQPGGVLTVTLNGTKVINSLPAAFTASVGRFGFGARTGYFSDEHWIDDIEIATTTAPAEHPFVVSFGPTGSGAREDAVVQIVVQDGVNALDPASIHLTFNGVVVAPGITKSGDLTTIQYDPPGSLASGTAQFVSLSFGDAISPPQVVDFTFETRYYLGPSGNVYEVVLVDDGITWEAAKVAAEARTYAGRAGHLVTITSDEEEMFVTKVRAAVGGTAGLDLWIGGSHTAGAAKNESWNWVNNEGAIPGANGGSTFAHWADWQPDDFTGPSAENYLYAIRGAYGWGDGGFYGWQTMPGYVVEYEALPVAIDIKPGDQSNVINVQSRGKVDVAVLSSAGFDATKMILQTVRFGRTGKEASAVASLVSDANGDGALDIIFSFNVQDTGLRCGDSAGILRGGDQFGLPVKGTEAVALIGCPDFGLTMAALQDVNRNTDLVLQVRPLLPGIASPTVANQAQFRSFKISGRPGWTRNVASIALTPAGDGSSIGVITFPDLLRQQKIDAKVSVRNGATGRSEILQADAVVVDKPDLIIESVIAPPTAATRRMVNIKVPVREGRGDLGAKAIAHLIDNGAVIDTVSDFVIEAGGQAMLVFTTSFTTPGAHQLQVVLSTIQPGDYDPSNNQAAFTINVNEPNFVEAAYWIDYRYGEYIYTREWDNDYSSGRYHEEVRNEHLTYFLNIPTAIDYPLLFGIASIVVDGVEKFHQEPVVEDGPTGPVPDDGGCYHLQVGMMTLPDNTTFYFNTETDPCSGYINSQIMIDRDGSDSVLVFSHEHLKIWGQTFEGFSKFPPPFFPQYHFLAAENTVQARATFDTANNRYGGSGQVTDWRIFDDPIQSENIFEGGYEREYGHSLARFATGAGITSP